MMPNIVSVLVQSGYAIERWYGKMRCNGSRFQEIWVRESWELSIPLLRGSKHQEMKWNTRCPLGEISLFLRQTHQLHEEVFMTRLRREDAVRGREGGMRSRAQASDDLISR